MVAGALIIVGVAGLLRDRNAGDATSQKCDEVAGPRCTGGTAEGPVTSQPTALAGAEAIGSPPTLNAAEACRNVGYLCAELERAPNVRLQRWTNFSGTIVVHVPRPDFEAGGDAIALQQAATVGLRAWNGQPFQILTDTRGDREAHFSVRWTRSLGGNQIGLTRTQWSAPSGLHVISIELATRSPHDQGTVIDPRQVRLTAAHEMGHALGLPHSDAPRDVMYPSNTATSLSAQDYRTMESLYRLPDGTEIVR